MLLILKNTFRTTLNIANTEYIYIQLLMTLNLVRPSCLTLSNDSILMFFYLFYLKEF